MISSIFGFLFGGVILSGVIIGIGAIIPLNYFFKYRLLSYKTTYNQDTKQDELALDKNGHKVPNGLINDYANKRAKWVDIVMSSAMFYVGFTKASLAIPLAVAGLCISAYVRTVTGLDQESWLYKSGDFIRSWFYKGVEKAKSLGQELKYSYEHANTH